MTVEQHMLFFFAFHVAWPEAECIEFTVGESILWEKLVCRRSELQHFPVWKQNLSQHHELLMPQSPTVDFPLYVDSLRLYFHHSYYYAFSDILISHLNNDNRTVSVTVELSTIAKTHQPFSTRSLWTVIRDSVPVWRRLLLEISKLKYSRMLQFGHCQDFCPR